MILKRIIISFGIQHNVIKNNDFSTGSFTTKNNIEYIDSFNEIMQSLKYGKKLENLDQGNVGFYAISGIIFYSIFK